MEDVRRSRFGRKIKPKKLFGDEEEISASSPKTTVTTAPKYRGGRRRETQAPELTDEVKERKSEDANEAPITEVEQCLLRESYYRGVMGAVEKPEQHQEEENDSEKKGTPREDGTIPMEEDNLPEPAAVGGHGGRKTLVLELNDEAKEGKAEDAEEASEMKVEQCLLRELGIRGVVGAVDPVEEAEKHQEEDNLNEKETLEEDEPIPIEEDELPEASVVGTLEISKMNTSILQISNMNVITITLGVLVSNKLKNKKKMKKMPAFRVNPYLLDRNIKGRFATDFQDLVSTEKMFRENFHMSVDEFEALFSILEPYLLPKRNTRPDDAIHPKQKLALVLEFLASGDLQRHISSCYRISKQHFGTIIDLVCSAVCDGLSATISEMNKESFLDVANDYHTLWNLPNCVGSIDGKHVAMKAPPGSGSMFYSYKGYFTLVMLGICDAHYTFTYLDVGAYGSEGDANIFRHSKFGQQVIDDQFEFPEDTSVDGVRLPYFFVGDDAFPLCKRIIKPYTGKKNAGRGTRV